MAISQIHNVYKKLTETEKKLASYILSNPEKVVRMTAKELADSCSTAPSAVIRLCKSVGLKGFSDLKISLAGEVHKSTTGGILPSFSPCDTAEDIFKKVFSSGIGALHNTIEMMDFESITSIAQKLFNAERIFIFGVGTSSVVANDAHYRFSQLGFHAYAYTDILYMNVAAMNTGENDVVIGISHSGETKAVVDALRHAKESGAKTLAITSFSRSTLSRECDEKLIVYSDEENYPVEAVSARIAHFCIVDALMMTLASMKYDDFSEYVEKRNRILKEIRY
ncbi:MAG: MurR/RpiR family transcriptional regulator [Ruminococcaceae bacterium]|nr:MurR/RpiR family transcriptional regulator [Oscillospiraceae bacterium]